jgi:hypothetical protein
MKHEQKRVRKEISGTCLLIFCIFVSGCTSSLQSLQKRPVVESKTLLNTEPYRVYDVLKNTAPRYNTSGWQSSVDWASTWDDKNDIGEVWARFADDNYYTALYTIKPAGLDTVLEMRFGTSFQIQWRKMYWDLWNEVNFDGCKR